MLKNRIERRTTLPSRFVSRFFEAGIQGLSEKLYPGPRRLLGKTDPDNATWYDLIHR